MTNKGGNAGLELGGVVGAEEESEGGGGFGLAHEDLTDEEGVVADGEEALNVRRGAATRTTLEGRYRTSSWWMRGSTSRVLRLRELTPISSTPR
jgi:hypothetical protein